MKSDKAVRVQFLGGVGSVTGSNFLVEALGRKILVDCGLFQGVSEMKDKNSETFLFNPAEIDFLFVTHAHLDHIGRIPKLVKEGFKGKIFSTPVTREISGFILEDALKVMEYKRREKGKEPFYSADDLSLAFECWQTVHYGKPIELGEGLGVVFKNAGHILGSAMVEFSFPAGDKTLVFTGDLGSWPNPLLKRSDKLRNVKYLVMESVYGDKNHGSLEDGENRFKEIVEDVVKKKGVLLIPAFSLERSQVILFELNKLVENKVIPAIPVFFDSPLAIKLTEIYSNSKNLFGGEVQKLIENGDDIFSFPKLVISRTPQESKSIKREGGPKVIIAGAGMSQGGRIVYHEAEYLSDQKNTLLLLGFQAVGTLGRLLEEGAKEVEINGKKIPVRAKVLHLDNFSAHRDSDSLLEFVGEIEGSLEKVFLAMGEPKASLFLAQRIKDYLGIDCSVPKEGESFSLVF